MKENSPYLSNILFCQQILKTEGEGKDKLTSLMNIFDNLVISTNAPDSAKISIPVECYLFTKLVDESPRENYQLVIEILAPSRKKLLQITGDLRNENISKAGHIGDILQPLCFKTDEDGDHLVVIRFQDQIIGQETLQISREFTPDP